MFVIGFVAAIAAVAAIRQSTATTSPCVQGGQCFSPGVQGRQSLSSFSSRWTIFISWFARWTIFSPGVEGGKVYLLVAIGSGNLYLLVCK